MNLNLQDAADVRAAVQFAVIQLCSEDTTAPKMSPRALAALSELTYNYAVKCLAPDLDAFCQHAKRKFITESDVLLAVRKNEDAMTRVREKLEEYANRTDALLQPSKKAGISKKQRPKAAPKKNDSSSDSSSSSSSDDDVVVVERKKKPEPTNMFDGSSEEDEAEWERLLKLRGDNKKASKPLQSDDSDSSTSSNAMKNQQQKKKPRFQWPTQQSNEDNSNNNPLLRQSKKPAAGKTGSSNSRVDEIIANMSMDSLPSDDDEENTFD